jgi:membrane fusion protein (multidrug efflux system)
MPNPFRQTLGALAHARRRRRRLLAGLGVAAALGAVWLLWFTLARVPLYAVSDRARVSASAKVHPVDVSLAGRVIEVALQPGVEVAAGQVLLVLDSHDVRLRIDEARAQTAGLDAQIAALDKEIAARALALAETERAGQAGRSEAAARRQQSEVAAALAASEATRAEQLRSAGVVPQSEWERARADQAEKQAAAAAQSQRMVLLARETQRALAEGQAYQAGLHRQVAELRADRLVAAAALARLEDELARHTVRAPVAGRLGQVRAPQVGAVVEAGQRVAVVVPAGALEIIAEIAPSEAVGRVRAGQRAQMRVDGFPWTQYGMLHGAVTRISSEPLDGFVQIEIDIDEGRAPAIPVQHGLSGTVEIELDQVSPAEIVLRAVGRLAAGRVP